MFCLSSKGTSWAKQEAEWLNKDYHINYGVIQGFPARKALTTHVKKYDIF